MDKDDGGSAFPQVESQQAGSKGEYHTEVYSAGGMSLRDYFAAHATDADVAAMRDLVPKCTKVKDDGNGTKRLFHGAEPDNWRALARYMHADWMLACRKTPNGPTGVTMNEQMPAAVGVPVEATVRPLVEKLASLARMSHYGCDDRWYSCPKHEDGTANEFKKPDECDCGADEHNAEVDALTARLLALLPAA